jgi:CheY-like chemotaxis protein
LCVFAEIGYRVRTAVDGFSALIEISREEPEILLSDLNMPGMSGFELLAEVRRRFPAIRTIAMSGAFNGSEVPSGVAADAFYEKGSSVGALVRMLQNLPWHERVLAGHAAGLTAAWVERDGHSHAGETQVTVSCPVCKRTFPQPPRDEASHVLETACVQCRSMIQLVGSGPGGQASAASFQEREVRGSFASSGTERLNS